MAAPDLGVTLLRTKIHRPAVDADHIHRPSLLARLDRQRHRPLTLISAPAGYGKSSLASCWLASMDVPGAWVSLDENDNEPRLFLAYVVAAVHAIFPGSLPKTQSVINAPILPAVSALAQSLVNELDAINADFVLVLDDYHAIKEKAVHDLLTQLLRHPPAPMKDMLLRTAILKQFDAGLCEALCADSSGDASTEIFGRQFIDWLIRSDLFVIALDDEGRWFRYHHLFQQLLVRLLKRNFSEDTIAALHKTASDWLDRLPDIHSSAIGGPG